MAVFVYEELLPSASLNIIYFAPKTEMPDSSPELHGIKSQRIACFTAVTHEIRVVCYIVRRAAHKEGRDIIRLNREQGVDSIIRYHESMNYDYMTWI